MALARSKVTVTVEYKFETDHAAALAIRDLLQDKDTTMMTDNIGLFDFEPDEKVLLVEIV